MIQFLERIENMPIWSNQIPKESRHMGFDLRRTPENYPIRAICTCEDMLCVPTHYWGGRTIPHEDENCPACNASVPYRIHVYVSCFDPKDREHFVLEITANAAKSFEEFKESYKTLRGCFFEASRPKKTRNGKVCIITKPADLTKFKLPDPPDLIRVLCTVWNLPLPPLEHYQDGISGVRPEFTDALLSPQREQDDNKEDIVSIGSVLNKKKKK
jgi:hypothetical protein